ncbi:MAG TPA: DUF3298 domain-containing protein [Dongiaceae bacterium]|nr:DUF3298 domain-containing protein [Dongiaceae bacterium]
MMKRGINRCSAMRQRRSRRNRSAAAVKWTCAAALAVLTPVAVSQSGAPAQAASFDCGKASQPLDQRICRNAELSHLDEDLAARYGKARAALSPAGQKLLQDSQRDWLAFARRICKTRLDAKIAKAAEQTVEDCLKYEYQERLDDLEGAVTAINGFTFQRVDLYGLAVDKIDPGMPSGARAGFSYRRISFPRIDLAPAGIDPTGWNRMIAIAAQKLAASGDGDDGAAMEAAAAKAPDNIVKPNIDQAEAADIDTAYDFGLVTPQMISVNLSYGVYGHGAAHPSGITETHSILLGEGRELTAKDLFKDGTDWQGFLVKRSHDAWVQIMEDAPDQVDDKAIADVVKDSRLWQLTDKGFAVFFPFYSVGPYVVGEQQVDLTWAELKPYLADNPPFAVPAKSN